MTTTRDYDLAMLRRPQLDDLAVNEYGDRAYGTPEATLWADALARAEARIANPRVLAPGLTFDGQSGNLDAPEDVTREIFEPLQQALMPREVLDRRMTDVDRSLIESRRAESARLDDRLRLDRDIEKRKALDEAQERALAERKAMNDFNLRSATVQRQGSRAKEFAIKNRIEMAREAVKHAQELRDPAKEAEALSELEKWEGELGNSEPQIPLSPAFIPPTTAEFPLPSRQPEAIRLTPAPLQVAPAKPKVDFETLKAQALEALKRKDPASVRRRFKELTGMDLQ